MSKVGETAKTSDFWMTVYGFKDPQPPVGLSSSERRGSITAAGVVFTL